MKVEVHPAAGLPNALHERWQALCDSHVAYASPYVTPQFAKMVGETRRDAFVGVADLGEGLVAFLPFHRLRGRRGRPIGLALSDHQAVVMDPAATLDVIALLRGCGLTSLAFDHLLGTQTAFAPFAAESTESPIMDLSAGFDAYALELRQRGSKQIPKLLALRRRLERDRGSVRFLRHTENLDALGTLMRWKASRHDQSREMFSRRWVRELLHGLHACQTPELAGVLSCLEVDGHVVAAHFGMRSKTVWHYWFPSYDESYAAYSPGLLLLLEMAMAAPSLGLRHIDLGQGDSLYKQRLMTGALPLLKGAVDVPCLRTSLRRAGSRLEAFVRRSRMAPVARAQARLLRRLRGSGRFD